MVGRHACCGQYRMSCSVMFRYLGRASGSWFCFVCIFVEFLPGHISLQFCHYFLCPATPSWFQDLATHQISPICTIQSTHVFQVSLTHRGYYHVYSSDPRSDRAASLWARYDSDDMC
jgi:hypothetical protein